MYLMENKKPIYFLKINPSGWKRASLPKLKESALQILSEKSLNREEVLKMNWSQRDEYLRPFVLQRQEICWKQETGIEPQDSHFTLIIPIHNEENSLPSFLGTLMLANVPSIVNMQVIFVTNACSDLSIDILRAFLSDLGKLETRGITDDFSDKGIDQCCEVVETGNLTYIHINTSTAGKANALRIGNTLAYRSGHLITISIDANNFIEPDAIRTMFSQAYSAFRDKLEPNDTVLLSGIGRESMKPSKISALLGKISLMKLHFQEVDETNSVVNGSIMAWNTKWMNELGGPPQVALEDYALGVLARVSYFKIKQAEGVNIWTYALNDFQGLLSTRARHVRGKRQLYDYTNFNQSIILFIEKEYYYMRVFKYRLRYLLCRIGDKPLNAFQFLATFLCWEYAIWKGMREYKRNPRNQSWEKIRSTY